VAWAGPTTAAHDRRPELDPILRERSVAFAGIVARVLPTESVLRGTRVGIHADGNAKRGEGLDIWRHQAGADAVREDASDSFIGCAAPDAVDIGGRKKLAVGPRSQREPDGQPSPRGAAQRPERFLFVGERLAEQHVAAGIGEL